MTRPKHNNEIHFAPHARVIHMQVNDLIVAPTGIRIEKLDIKPEGKTVAPWGLITEGRLKR